MRIINFKPSDNFRREGLKFKEMRNLKQVVALFGRNGSGKSRLLAQLANEVSTHELANILSNIDNFEKEWGKDNLKETQKTVYQNLLDQRDNLFKDIEFEIGDSIMSISGRDVSIQSPENMNDSEYRSNALGLTTNPNFEIVKQNCAKFIKALCKSEIGQVYHKNVKDKGFYASHDEIQAKNIKLLSLLKDLIREIMNKDLNYRTDEHLTPILTLNDRVLSPHELSDGEKELLAYCTYLVLQGQDEITNKTLSLKGKVLLLDEVELFLHPKAQIDLIKGLRKLVGDKGQIWIATHSLAILSVLDRDEVWLMDDGDIISPSIETPNKVLGSLVGEENLDSLENFVSSQYEWASIQFALESLFPPTVVTYKEGDVQQGQIKERLLNSDSPVKILDFGAGNGRIALEIIRNPDLASQVYYQALEINKEKHVQLEKLSSQLQKMSSIETIIAREVLDTHDKLDEKKYNDCFDMIFMVNVLHEIPLNKWSSILNALLQSLKKDGKLVILEDQAIPRGENAHEYGFLILNIEEFKLLFSLENAPKQYVHENPRYTERLTCVEIPKEGSNVSKESKREALNRKKTNCKTEINNLRDKKDKTARDGRKNSYLTQLYANVSMALDDDE